MAHVLIFEDSKERIKLFKQALINHTVVYAGHVALATKHLEKEAFDIAFLDHDIEGSRFTGYTLVKWMIDRNLHLPVIYHTANHPGYLNMSSLIPGEHFFACWLLDVKEMNKLIKETIDAYQSQAARID